ncbi:hypothetical protein RI367_006371 [Sorochytrium milnesiophthora]
MQAAGTFFPKDTGITLLQQVAQLKARLDVYDAHANVPSPAVTQHTFIPASMVPKPTPFDGRPENREHFVVSINNFLGLTLSPQTPTSVKVRAFGLYLGDEPCRWFGDLIAAQPHLLEDYDAFLQALNRNYAGYDHELEARHAALPRNFEEFDRVEACRQSLRPAVLRLLASYQGNKQNFAELIDAVKRVQRADFQAAFLASLSNWAPGEYLTLSTTEVLEVADESESHLVRAHFGQLLRQRYRGSPSSASTAAPPVAPAMRKSTAQAGAVRTRGRDLGKDCDTATELDKPKTLEVALGSHNTRALCLRLHFKSPRNQDVIALALLDSGATQDLIDPRLLRKIGARQLPLAQPEATRMADGSTPAAAYIHHKTVDITYSSG